MEQTTRILQVKLRVHLKLCCLFNESRNLILGSNFGYHVCDCHYEEEGCVEEDTRDNTCNCDANLPIPMTGLNILHNNPILQIDFVSL